PVTANSSYFIKLRVDLQSLMVKHAARRFVQNIEQCYDGTLDEALLEDRSQSHVISTTLKEVAREYAFSHPEVESSELQGHQIICGLLDKYKSILSLERSVFETLMREAKGPAIALRMFKKVAKKHINAYLAATKAAPQDEYYYRCRMIQDHISGMTDHFAYDEYKLLYVTD
ncbi:MAG: dGTPase, partial [Pseudomonadota bacterium]